MDDSVVIGWGKETQVDQLCDIWMMCFFDSIEYCRFFFSHYKTDKNTLVLTLGEEPVSMLSLLPASMYINGVKRKLAYIYAVATLPQFQKRGYSTKLLNYASDLLNENKILPILVPASDELKLFYAKKGYYPASYKKTIKLEIFTARGVFSITGSNEEHLIKNNVDIALVDISANEYKNMRDAFFAKDGYIEWSLSDIEYRIKETAYWGGLTCKVVYRGNKYALIAYCKDNTLIIKEAIIPEDVILDVVIWVAVKLNCSNVNMTLPSYSGLIGETKMLAMATSASFPNNSYLNLVLD